MYITKGKREGIYNYEFSEIRVPLSQEACLKFSQIEDISDYQLFSHAGCSKVQYNSDLILLRISMRVAYKSLIYIKYFKL
jgi:hypothetical protein